MVPNDDAIASAFCEHGIALIYNINLHHDELVTIDVPLTPISIEATLEVDYPEFVGATKMYWRTSPGVAYNEIEMTDLGGANYSASIPAQPQVLLLNIILKQMMHMIVEVLFCRPKLIWMLNLIYHISH